MTTYTREFFQDGPELKNQFDDDTVLKAYLERVLPRDVLEAVTPDLKHFGERVVTDVLAMADDAEAHEPVLVPYDAWGRRIDRIETARGWQDLDRVAAEEGLVAIGYERRYGSYSRLYQFAKLHLFGPSSAIYNCPLAMTDGAARLIEVHGDDELKAIAFSRLTSRDPGHFWTSGQWMTERAGGSDVGRIGTGAEPLGGNRYALHGDKWFTSATTAQMAITLARISATPESAQPGSRGLSLFYLETRRPDGTLNGITINRLKSKLGTRALPTAELSLDGTAARLIGEPGQGVKQMATLFNITRIYNAVNAVAQMRRLLALARDYARRRQAFGRKLIDHPLHVETLADLETTYRGCFCLTYATAALQGRLECGEATDSERATLRILTPITKLFTARHAIALTSEVLECFGGAGYIEDTGLPKWLRDGQVLSIWEGTTNVLSLDVLRAIEREAALAPLLAVTTDMLAKVRAPLLTDAATKVRGAVETVAEKFNDKAHLADRLGFEAGARQLAFSLARTFAGAALLEHADWALRTGSDPAAPLAARRWCAADLVTLVHRDQAGLVESRMLALGSV